MEFPKKVKDNNYNDYFPYAKYRKGQEEIIKEISNHIKNKGHYLLIAPNGTGKSIISLASTLPVIYSNNLKLIYLCRTHQQNDRIVKEIRKIKRLKQPNLNGIALKGRKSLCLNEDLLKKELSFEDLMIQCELLRKRTKDYGKKGCYFYTKFANSSEMIDPELNNLYKDFTQKVARSDKIIDMCEEKEICPYYFIRNLLKHMKIVVCNYNWIFHDGIRGIFLKELNKVLGDCIVIIDECHNLPEAVLNINEKKISNIILIQCNRMLKYFKKEYSSYEYFKKFNYFLDSVYRYLNIKLKKYEKKPEIKKSDYPYTKAKDPKKLLEFLMKNSGIYDLPVLEDILSIFEELSKTIYDTIDSDIKSHFTINWIEIFTEFWRAWIRCCLNDELHQKHYYGIKFEKEKNKNKTQLELKPLDSRDYINPIIENSYSTLHISGTLIPEVYKSLTSLDNFQETLIQRKMKTPFSKEQIRVFIVKGLTSKYLLRGPKMYRKINNYIREILETRKGNTGIFAVSYDFLKKLNSKKLGTTKLKSFLMELNRPYFEEKRKNTSSDNSKLINDFKTNTDGNGAVLLGVLGGRNSEGEDFPGNTMETVIIVGFPFPAPNDYLNKKQSYYNSIFPGKGFFYANLDPTIRKANQAAGRPIRKDEDKAAIIFLDERYSSQEYFEYLSDWLRDDDVVTIINYSQDLRQYLEDF